MSVLAAHRLSEHKLNWGPCSLRSYIWLWLYNSTVYIDE